MTKSKDIKKTKRNKKTKKQSAYMELVIGPMFAGKTSYLINIAEIFTNHNEKIKVLIINHSSDTRVKGEFIATHDKKRMKAIKRSELLPLLGEKVFLQSDIVLIDETQFFDDVVEFVKQAETMSKRIYFAGLKGDANRKPFENISNLIPLMDHINDIQAIDFTSQEMRKAPFTRRKKGNGKKIEIGGSDIYESVSRETFLYH